MVRGGSTYRIVTDYIGSPRVILDVATGAAVQTTTYDEFGQVTFDTNREFQPFGFAGGLYDSGTGFVRFGSRDYDAGVGRWTAKDPISFAGKDSNLYGDVFTDPINLGDPVGLASLRTNVEAGTTTFDPRPEEASGVPITVPSSNRVSNSNSLPGAGDPFSTPDVSRAYRGDRVSYGPDGAYIETGDPRHRNLHGGGSFRNITDPYAPRQGWCPTYGCTRLQNEDINRLGDAIQDFQSNHPGVPIPYDRR